LRFRGIVAASFRGYDSGAISSVSILRSTAPAIAGAPFGVGLVQPIPAEVIMRLVRPLAVLLLAAACVSLSASSQTVGASAAANRINRITAPIDEDNLVALPGNTHPLAQAQFDVGAAPASMATGRITLVFERSAAQQQALTQYLDDVQNPASPSFHKWLTPAQYGAAFGIGDSDLQTVESWLQGHGFKIEKVPQGRNVIQFSGTAGQVESAFHTSIHAFSVGGATHYANIGDPQIPAALAPVVANVGPLNNFHPKSQAVTGTRGHYDATTRRIEPNLTLFNGNTPILFVDPADAATIYDTPNTNLNANYTSGTTYDGTGVMLGILGDSNIPLGDVQNYRLAFLGETSSNVNLPTVIVEGEDPGVNGDAVEALLDLEVSGGIAPKAKVFFYTSADSDVAYGLNNAMVRAIDDNAVSVLSMSFGECEAFLGTGGNAFMLEEAQQAAAQGISWTVSAGDGGSAGCDNFDTESKAVYGLQVSGMASTPWTIAVGGTDFDVLPSSFATYANDSTSGSAPYYRTALKYIPENPWNDSTKVDTVLANNVSNGNIVAGSGGVSSIYGKPAFQTSLTPADNARDLPDVSLFASNGNKQAVWVICSDNVTDGDPSDTYTDCQTSGGQLENNTTFEGVGGTSASSPAFAGMLALVAQSQSGARLGQANTILYQLAKSKYATVFHDITVGNNSVPCANGSGNCGANGFLTGYNTGTGYDLATGLGSVDVNQLIQNWGSVALTPTTTTFSIDGSTAAYAGVHGATVTFNAGVNPTAATGAVAVIDTANVTSGGTTSGPQSNGQLSIALTSGAGTTTWNGLPGGTYTVSGRYTGDTSDASSTSTPISVTISAEASTTSLQVNGYDLSGNASPLTAIPYGHDVVADAQILGKAEGSSTEGVATGSVTYIDGSTTVGTATVRAAGNYATFPAPATPYVYAVGSHSLTAKYSGDPSFSASTSAAVAFTVVKATTSMTATEASASVNYNDASDAANVTITTPYNIGVAPTGTVTMTGNGTTVGTIASLTASVASGTSWVLAGAGAINGNLLAPGNNVVTLTYSGDANYASTSTTANIESTIGLGSFTIANSGNVSQVAGETGTTAITITPAGGFYSEISFSCASSGPVTCSATPLTVTGSAAVPGTVSISSALGAALGTYPVTVTGTDQTGKITASSSFNVTLTAVPANAGIALSNSGPITLTAGATNSAVPITVSATNGYVGIVNLTCVVTTNLSSPTSAPTCSAGGPVTVNSAQGTVSNLTVATTATTSAGTYSITVTGTDSTIATITANTQFTLTVNAAPAIALSDSGNITVSPGATSGNLSTISITPANGFTGQVNLTCAVTGSPTGASDLPTCNIAPSVNITGTKAVTATLIVSTTGATSSALDLPLKTFFLGGGGGVLALALFFGIPARRRAWRALFGVLALVVIAGAIGCGGGGGNGGGGGGGGNSGTTAGAYTITVTGTDAATGKVTSNVAVTLTVN
jgi:hypothetical protein